MDKISGKGTTDKQLIIRPDTAVSKHEGPLLS